MPVSLEIISIPLGSILVRSIGANDPESLNDFAVLIIADANGTGLEESDITFSTGASLVALTGDGVTREAVIRPPETAGTLTITIAANAFAEGNAQTSKDIRLSRSFPDVDAETPSQLINTGTSGNFGRGIAVGPTRIFVTTSSGSARRLHSYNHSGIEQTSEELSLQSNHDGTLDYFNGDLIANGAYRFSPQDDTRFLTYPRRSSGGANVHTRLGILEFRSRPTFSVLPYGTLESADIYDIEATPASDFLFQVQGSDASHIKIICFTCFSAHLLPVNLRVWHKLQTLVG